MPEPRELPEKWRSLANDIRKAKPGRNHPSADMADRCAAELRDALQQ